MTKHLEVEICMGSSCFSRGNSESLEIIEAFTQSKEIPCDITLKGCLCKKSCSSGPVILIDGHTYEEVDSSCIEDLLLKHVR